MRARGSGRPTPTSGGGPHDDIYPPHPPPPPPADGGPSRTGRVRAFLARLGGRARTVRGDVRWRGRGASGTP